MRKTILLFVIIVVTSTLIGCHNTINKVPGNSEQQSESYDTLYSFFGKQLILNDSIIEQIAQIADNNDKLSYDNSDSVLKILEVEWKINLNGYDFELITSENYDSPKIMKIYKYLNQIYGEPYEGGVDDGWVDCKWSSSNDSLDIFRPGSTLVRLKGQHIESGSGATLYFN
jgi:hypothetical protein